MRRLKNVPHTVAAVGTVGDALAALSVGRPDAVYFVRVPPDVERLGELPGHLPLSMPFREGLLEFLARSGRRLTVRLRVGSAGATGETRRAFLQLSRHGLDSEVEDINCLAPHEALDVFRLYARDGGITRSIDPFHAIMRRLLGRHSFSLWELMGPFEADRAVDDFIFSLPQKNPDCLVCPFFCFCQGYGAWAGSCATWRAVLKSLVGEARALRRAKNGRRKPCGVSARTGARTGVSPSRQQIPRSRRWTSPGARTGPGR